MSLNSLASNRVVRESAAKRRATSAAEATGFGTKTADDVASARAAPSRFTEDGGTGTEDVQNAMSALIEYLPSETISLYLAAASALTALQKYIGFLTAAHIYWTFAILTPVLYLLIYAGKRQAKGERPLPGWRDFPVWPMVAATLAFLAWALAGPNRPYLTGEDGDVLVGLVALLVSTLLGVLARVFVKPTAT